MNYLSRRLCRSSWWLCILALAAAIVTSGPTGAQTQPTPEEAIQAILASQTCPVIVPGPNLAATEAPRITKDGPYLKYLGAPPGCYFPFAGFVPTDPGGSAGRFMVEKGPAFYKPAGNFGFPTDEVVNKFPRSSVRLNQSYKSILIYGAYANVQLVGTVNNPGPALAGSVATGGVESVLADILRDATELEDGSPSATPTKTPQEAQQDAIRYMVAQGMGSQHRAESAPQLFWFVPSVLGLTGDIHLVYAMDIVATDNSNNEWKIFVDAHTGEFVFQVTNLESALDRDIYDANNVKGTDPGTLTRQEGDPASGTQEVDDIYDNFGAVWNFYNTEHTRDSIDGGGQTMVGVARYCPADPPAPKPPAGCPMRNAFWSNGAQRMRFGDGYESDDVTGHELTHGVTSKTSKLIYANQSGGINESLSDVWGEYIDQRTAYGNDSAAAKWLIGEDIPGGAIRSMKDPTLYNDPDRMGSPNLRPNTATPDDTNDQGGVHTNSGVNNKLCYLLTDGDTFNGHTITGKGISTIADLYYEAQTDNLLGPSSDYADLGMQLTQAAINLGWSDADRANLREALCAVEIIPNGCANDVTACIFDDHNANGVKDSGEDNVNFVGWGFTWDGGCGGSQTITAGKCVRLFGQQAPGTYNVSLNVNATDCKFDDPTGNGKRWQYTTPKTVTLNLNCGDTVTLQFGVVQLGKITVQKFDDSNMDKAKQPGESFLAGWPIRVDGPTAPLCPTTWPANGVTEYVLADLIPGQYTLKEDLPWETVQPCATDPYTVNRVTFSGKRWQATTGIEQVFTLTEAAVVTRQFGNVCLGTLNACAFNDKNTSGTRQATAEAFTDTNGNNKWDPTELYADINHNGAWDPAEPYTDTNGNGRYDSGEPFVDLNSSLCWDAAEPLRDENNNGVWDPAEPWTDTFANGVWDDAEELQAGWPVAVCGTSADGKCIGPITGVTGAGGCVELKDIPPGNFQVYQDSVWCNGKIDWCDGGVLPARDLLKSTYNGRRWLSTSGVSTPLAYSECSVLSNFEFGNVCLATITGNLTLKNCPDSVPQPLAGWNVCLRAAKVEQTKTFTALPLLATNPDCNDLAGNCTVTAPDGGFRFGELVPGIYLARENDKVGYAPVGDPVDLCVPYRLNCEDVDKQLQVRDITAVCPIYQAYPAGVESDAALASYEANPPVFAPQFSYMGYNGLGLDPVRATAGVFAFEPGSKWRNFVSAVPGCAPYCLKNVVLTKEHFPLRQCSDVFPALKITQQGTNNIRTWWPLLYTSPGTTFTLNILYGTSTPQKLPGEAIPSVVHNDVWKWRVEVTLDSMSDLVDVFHTLPFGLDEVPLISDDRVYRTLQGLITQAAQANNAVDKVAALNEMELLISDSCVSISPSLPKPVGPGIGIAQTRENPACCKLLADLDWLLMNWGQP